jgi:hypothetical protein
VIGLPVVQGHAPCPPEVMALAQELSESNEDVFDADEDDAVTAANRRFRAAIGALAAAGWRLGGPTRNVPGGELSWEVVPISRVAT